MIVYANEGRVAAILPENPDTSLPILDQRRGGEGGGKGEGGREGGREAPAASFA